MSWSGAAAVIESSIMDASIVIPLGSRQFRWLGSQARRWALPRILTVLMLTGRCHCPSCTKLRNRCSSARNRCMLHGPNLPVTVGVEQRYVESLRPVVDPLPPALQACSSGGGADMGPVGPPVFSRLASELKISFSFSPAAA